MSSGRAHTRLTGQQHEATKKQMPGHASQVPIKPTTVDRGEQQRGPPHVARMMKRTSRTTPSIEPYVKGSTRVPAPMTAAAHTSAIPDRRVSTTPSSFAPPAIRTPSLFSGSSGSTFDSPRSTGLRRKPSGAIDRYAAQRGARSGTMDHESVAMHGMTGFYHEDGGDTVLGITIPTTSKFDKRQAPLEMAGYTYNSNASRDLSPPVPHYASSATPSTRYSDSPFSSAPTLSSASSCSPRLAAPSYSNRSPMNTRSNLTGPAIHKDDHRRTGLALAREASPWTKSSPSAGRVEAECAGGRQIAAKEESTHLVPAASSGKLTFRNRLTKAKPDIDESTHKQKVRMPPELAHLNVDVRPDVLKPRAPARPSRLGTSTIVDMVDNSAVVHSDLPPVYTTYHKRTPSQESPTSASSSRTKSRFGFSSRASSRAMSPRVDSAISPSTPARQFHRSQTPEISSSGEASRLRRKDSPAVSQSPAKSPRFGFLSRKPKPELPKPAEKPARRMSKGPAAGSGHEGYGKFSFRGRSGSSASSGGLRSPSSDSISSGAPRPAGNRKTSTGSTGEPNLDDFLSQRLRPVILRGSGSTMSTDTVTAGLEAASSKSSSSDRSSQSQLLPSAMRKGSDSSIGSRPSARWMAADSSEDDVVRRQPTLATRRSITRLFSGENRSPVRVPPPINLSLLKQPLGVDSYDAEPTAWPRAESSLPLSEDGKEGLWMRPLDIKPPLKPAREWNVLRRATTSSPTKVQRRIVEPVGEVTPLQNRAVAHYALLDDVSALGIEDVEQIVRDSTDFEEDSLSDLETAPTAVPHEGRHINMVQSSPTAQYGQDEGSSARPYPPRLKIGRQDSGETSNARPTYQHHAAVQTPDITRQRTPEQVHHRLSTSEQTNGFPRPPRLSPVGRIPAVVSRRDRDRKLPNTSFSRPFASQNRPFVKPPGSVYSQIRDMASTTEPSSQLVPSTSGRSDNTTSEPRSNTQTNPSVSTDRTSSDMHMQPEFLVFPRRKNPDQSYSNSDSSSIPSWMTTLPPQREDVWNEYNDFMDEVILLKTSMRTPTKDSSLGEPFQYSGMLFDGNGTSCPIPTRTGLPPTQQLPDIPGTNTVQTVLAVPQQISRFLRPSLSPITPDTVSGRGGHTSSYLPRQASLHKTEHPTCSSLMSAHASISSGSRHGNGSAHSPSASVPKAHDSSSQISQDQRLLKDMAESLPAPQKSVMATPDLRLGALMTSKWLSFNHLLFSPAHNELQLSSSASSPRILVIDNLNSDWSHFLATSYPKAEIYNLSTHPSENTPPLGSIPPNHRPIPLTSLSASFPFPKAFFHSIVFRFPTATTETAYRACLSECKRVLRPGGFLEVAVLDLDLMNMGPTGRKAVRGLKTRMQQRDREVCLGNLSDFLVRVIGRKGFENVQRCVVGVPAAVGNHENDNEIDDNDDDDDERMTKMVARVGRWWYSSCYERSLLPGGDGSIWKDGALVRECERQGTSFRLLICYAQKAELVRRRTRSV